MQHIIKTPWARKALASCTKHKTYIQYNRQFTIYNGNFSAEVYLKTVYPLYYIYPGWSGQSKDAALSKYKSLSCMLANWQHDVMGPKPSLMQDSQRNTPWLDYKVELCWFSFCLRCRSVSVWLNPGAKQSKNSAAPQASGAHRAEGKKKKKRKSQSERRSCSRNFPQIFEVYWN